MELALRDPVVRFAWSTSVHGYCNPPKSSELTSRLVARALQVETSQIAERLLQGIAQPGLTMSVEGRTGMCRRMQMKKGRQTSSRFIP